MIDIDCYKPEIGEVCEAWLDGKYRKAEALKYHAKTDAVAFDFGFSLKWSSNYRPCKTEREQFIEKAAEIFKGPEQALYSMISGALYDNGARFKED